jgi:nucleoside-diphosphate-sugar epimerase
MMTAMPAVPRLATTVVDVRDAADLHLRAMTHPAAAGKRFLASTGEPMSFQDVAAELRDAVGLHPTRLPVLPDGVVREAAKTDPGMAGMVGELGEVRRVSSAKAQTVLDWSPRSNTEALRDTAMALQELGALGEAEDRTELSPWGPHADRLPRLGCVGAEASAKKRRSRLDARLHGPIIER